MSIIKQDDFNRADSALGGVANGWTDTTTGWQISSNKASSPTAGFATKFLGRPSSENTATAKLTATVNVVGGHSAICWLRQSTNNGLGAFVLANVAKINRFIGGVNDKGFNCPGTFATGTDYRITFCAYSTIFSHISVALASAPNTPLAWGSFLDSTYPTAGLASFSPLSNGNTVDDVVYETQTAVGFVHCDGDSRTLGTPGPVNQATDNWPYVLLGMLGERWGTINLGVGGQTVAQMDSDAATQIDAWQDPSILNIVAAWGMTNDLVVDGVSLATIQTRYQTYCANRQASGKKVIAFTDIKRTDISGANETIRTSWNAWLRLNYRTFADALVDLDADSRFSDFTNATYYHGDHIHLTTAGDAVVAQLVYPVVLSLASPVNAIKTNPAMWMWSGFGFGFGF